MTRWQPFNINHRVKVKLKPEGVAELKRQHDKLRQVFPKLPPFELRLDADGYYCTQLWYLMKELGHLCEIGMAVPFETEIQFEVTP